jgi:hypothetical protein
MTIDRLSELYLNNYYSKANFYLGLIEILSGSEHADHVMERVPEAALDVVFAMAERHFESAGEHSDREQQKNPEKILRWRDRRREALAAAKGNGAGGAEPARPLPGQNAEPSGAR